MIYVRTARSRPYFLPSCGFGAGGGMAVVLTVETVNDVAGSVSDTLDDIAASLTGAVNSVTDVLTDGVVVHSGGDAFGVGIVGRIVRAARCEGCTNGKKYGAYC